MEASTHAKLHAYATLVDRVDDFHRIVSERRAVDIACRPGCDGCCRVKLSVSPVEAEAIRDHLLTLGTETIKRLRARMRLQESAPTRCVMLEDDSSCAVYSVRPLVCRTQGLALMYPAGTFPDEVVLANGDEGSDIVWCPLNFNETPPNGSDVLDAGRLDEMLALINLHHVGGDRQAALERVSLDTLVEVSDSIG